MILKQRQGEFEDCKDYVRRFQEELVVEGQRVQVLEEVLGDLRVEFQEQEKVLLVFQQQCVEQVQKYEEEVRVLQDNWLQVEVMFKERDQELDVLRVDSQFFQYREEVVQGQVEVLQEVFSKVQVVLQEKEQYFFGQVELSRSLEVSIVILQVVLDFCQV